MRWPGGPDWGWRGGQADPGDLLPEAQCDRALRRLQQLSDRSPFEVAVAEGASHRTIRLSCSLCPPAAPETLTEAEMRLGTPLPADYRRFLMHSDGAILLSEVGPDGRSDGGAELLGAAALVRHAEESACDYRDGCIPELLIFAALSGDCDRLAFEIGRMNPWGGCGVLDARRDYRPDQWWVIARDFSSWLDTVLSDLAHPWAFGRTWGGSAASQPQLPLDAADDEADAEEPWTGRP